MPNKMKTVGGLSIGQQEALLELASHGSSGSFDQWAINELFSMDLVEVRSGQVALTENGRTALDGLSRC
jgi:hypothetical protein